MVPAGELNAVHLGSGLMSAAEMEKEVAMELERERERVEIEAEEILGKTHVVVEAELMVAEGDPDNSDDSGDEDNASGAETVSNVNVVEVTEVRHSLSQEPAAQDARRKKKARALVNLTTCDYAVIKEACKRFGWRFTTSEKAWSIRWTDRYCIGQALRDMKLMRPQRINHFPAMCEIAFKCRLANNLNRLRKLCPDDYDFYPETWVLPEDTVSFTKVP